MLARHHKLIAVVAAAALIAGYAYAGSGCCSHCGRPSQCRKVCRLVCEQKKVDVCCWGCQCEPFCVPGPSRQGCQHCQTVCDDCPTDPKSPQSEPKRFVWSDWFPTGASIHTRTKLMRKTVQVTVPSYKWVVEDMCTGCTDARAIRDPARFAGVPTPPPGALPIE